MKKKLKTWEEAWADLDAAYRMSCKSTRKRFPKGYVFDEEKSVRWNAEEVERNNEAAQKETSELQRNRSTAINSATGEIVKLIVHKFDDKINEKQACIIWNLAYEEGHAYGCIEIENHLDELMNTFKDFIAKGEQNGV